MGNVNKYIISSKTFLGINYYTKVKYFYHKKVGIITVCEKVSKYYLFGYLIVKKTNQY